MATNSSIKSIIEFLTSNTDQTKSEIAIGTGLTEKAVEVAISRHNKEAAEGERILNMRHGNSRYFIYWLESVCNRTIPEAKPKLAPVIAAMAKLSPSLEQSSAHIAQYIAGQMRAEFDARLAVILRPAIECGIAAMMTSIRTAMADAFKLPESISSQVVVVDDVAPKSKASASVEQPAPVITMHHVPAAAPSPIVNVLSTRTKHRDIKAKATEEAAKVAANAEARLAKVFIIGLHDNKQEFIRREYRECFDLRIYNPDRLRAFQDALTSGDVAFLMADFVSHKHQDVIESKGAKCILVYGGLTHLREALTKHYCEMNPAAA